MTIDEVGTARSSAGSPAGAARRLGLAGPITSGAFGLSTTAIVALTRAPWWIAAALIVGSVICAVVANVFPQDSTDRLEWWRG